MSVKEELSHARFGVAQVEGKVQHLLTRTSDPLEDPFDLQRAARKLVYEIEDAGSSLLTPEFAGLASWESRFGPTPEWEAYDELHNRLHNVRVDLDRAWEIIKERFPKRNTAGLS
jgi:hypothetical protein